jgi:dUTP pyrophosphatase
MSLVKIKLLHPLAKLPAFAKPGDAGADLVATEKLYDPNNRVVTFKLGIASEIPPGYEIQIRPRSSIYKTGLVLCNSTGTIDAGYRGEWLAKFYIINPGEQTYNVGDRICQAILHKLPEVEYTQVDELSDSERGAGGHGSTGR